MLFVKHRVTVIKLLSFLVSHRSHARSVTTCTRAVSCRVAVLKRSQPQIPKRALADVALADGKTRARTSIVQSQWLVAVCESSGTRDTSTAEGGWMTQEQSRKTNGDSTVQRWLESGKPAKGSCRVIGTDLPDHVEFRIWDENGNQRRLRFTNVQRSNTEDASEKKTQALRSQRDFASMIVDKQRGQRWRPLTWKQSARPKHESRAARGSEPHRERT